MSIRVVPLVCLSCFLLLFSFPAAANVNSGCRCQVSDDRVRDADRWLWLNTRDKRQAIARHAPWGTHLSQHVDKANEQLLVQRHYLLNHDGDLRTSVWAAHRLTSRDLSKPQVKRLNCFRKDVRVDPDAAGMCSDYSEPIFDQGHIVPDADQRKSRRRALQTYMMSNMQPQYCNFNRGVWLLLENLTRDWARRFKVVWVTSGALYDRDGVNGRDHDDEAVRMQSDNGKARVAVASHFYRIVVYQKGETVHSLSFIVPHTDNKVPSRRGQPEYLSNFITTISEIESRASLQLYPYLERESLLETSREEGLWETNSGWPSHMGHTC